jgi:N-acetylneuraminate synthase
MKTQFIAEVSSNHHANLERCKQFIQCSKDIGCDGVKFQLFRIRELFAPEILAKSETHRLREAWELPASMIPELSAFSRSLGLDFSCTPFYLEAVDELEPYVDFYKIASYELLWDELLQRTAKTGKPVVLSTGMATMDEIKHATQTLRESGCVDLTLLHCISGYPTPVEQCNLQAIETIRHQFNCQVGWSDHSVQPAVLYRAIHKYQASMVEFHLDLDGKGEEYSSGHCWLPNQIEQVIQDVSQIETMDGSGEKVPAAAEISDREWRADPVDGLRPLKHIRKTWNG